LQQELELTGVSKAMKMIGIVKSSSSKILMAM